MSNATATREIYCLKCRARTVSDNLEPSTLSNGKNAVKGKCTTCGTKTYTIVAQKK
jgi:hypothetical protein